MNREVLPTGKIYLTSDIGIMDTRTEAEYSEVVCKEKNEKFFREVEDE